MLDGATHEFFKYCDLHITKLINERAKAGNVGNIDYEQNRLFLNINDQVANFMFPKKLIDCDDQEVLAIYLTWLFNHIINFAMNCSDEQ